MATKTLIASFIALLSGWVPATQSTAASTAPCRGLTTTIRTFHVEIDWHKKVYRQGATVKVSVGVGRPADEDPMNNRIPLPLPERVPAEGVNVTGALLIDPPYYPYDVGVTDAEGLAELSIDLPKDFTGPVDTSVRAWLWHNEGGPACTDVMEETIVQEERSFKVR